MVILAFGMVISVPTAPRIFSPSTFDVNGHGCDRDTTSRWLYRLERTAVVKREERSPQS
jgi:hypothetical protein